MKLLKNNIKDIIVFLSLIALLILGSFFDFKFSDKINIGNSWINFAVEIIAKIPLYGLAMYACVNLLVLAKNKQNIGLSYCMMAVYLIGAVICGTLMLEDAVSAFIDGIWKYFIAAVLACAICVYLYSALLKVDLNKIQNNKKEYLSIIISVAIIVVMVFLLKKIVDRTRFVDVLTRNGEFTQWYEKGTGGDSFPSGHVASAIALFSAIPLLRKTNWYKGKEWIVYLVVSIFTICVMLSRISFGMHYLSDTAAAGLIGFMVSKIVDWAMYGFNTTKLEIKEGSFLDKI